MHHGPSSRFGCSRPLKPDGRLDPSASSVVTEEVEALKRQVYNQDKGGIGWKTSVSESLGYLKPFSPLAGSLGSVLAQV